MAQRKMMPFVLYVIAFALGIATFIISVLSAASSTEIGALLSIHYFVWASPGLVSERAFRVDRVELKKSGRGETIENL